MGGRKVCFISDEGQVATCIRDDEDCTLCDDKLQHEKVQEHVSRYARSREAIHILNQTMYGIRDLASSFARTGNEKIAEELRWRASNIGEARDAFEHDIDRFAKGEFERLKKGGS